MVLYLESPIIDETMISNNPGKMSVKIGITRVIVEMKTIAVNNDPIIEAVYFPSILNFIHFYYLIQFISLHRLSCACT